jgi:hypothetical protein
MISSTENLLEDFEKGLVKGEEADGDFCGAKKGFINVFGLGETAVSTSR